LSDSPIVLPTTRDLPLPVFFGLREGTYRQLVADNAEGIISLHAALGALFIFALWPVKWLHRIALFINLVMIAATPIEGEPLLHGRHCRTRGCHTLFVGGETPVVVGREA